MNNLFTNNDGLSESVVREIETNLQVSLPEDYREFLSRHNGGKPQRTMFRIRWQDQAWASRFPYSSIQYLFSHMSEGASELEKAHRTYRGRIPFESIAVGKDSGGNLILLGVSGLRRPNVYFWAKDYEVDEGEIPDWENVGFAAGSWNSFLDGLFEQ